MSTIEFEQLCPRWPMDLQHCRGNAIGWQQMKRQRSPTRDNRPLKKRFGSENVAPEKMTSKSWLKTARENIHQMKKLSPKEDRDNINTLQNLKQNSINGTKEIMGSKEPNNNIQLNKVDRQMTFTSEDIEEFDIDDIIPINLNLNKVPRKFCDDRVYVDFIGNSDNTRSDTPLEDISKQEDDNFKEKFRKPLNELMDLLDVHTDEEPLKYLLVGMKLQLMGMRMAKLEGICVGDV